MDIIKKQVIIGLFIISSQILCIKPINSAEQDILDCAKVLQLSNKLEMFLSLRQKVIQNPTEKGYRQLIEGYNHFVENATVKSQTTDLHEAAKNGNISAIYHLIRNQRMDVNIRGIHGVTPLFVASFNVMPLLFSLGADVNISDALGATSLHYVALQDALPKAIYCPSRG